MLISISKDIEDDKIKLIGKSKNPKWSVKYIDKTG